MTDLKSGCSGSYPGADIDAVGAIGSTFQISLDASVLFEFNKSDLRPRAQAALTDAAAKIAACPPTQACRVAEVTPQRLEHGQRVQTSSFLLQHRHVAELASGGPASGILRHALADVPLCQQADVVM